MRQRLNYQLERWLLKGAWYRLVIIAVVIFVLSILGGLAVLPLGADDLTSMPDASWWAFLRMTDPGYLGDDTGVWRRLVSTVLTLCGYVLFMGALIAVMTQALNTTISRLERGETPIAIEGHILVVGWTDRSASIIRQFLLSKHRTPRFLARRGARDLQVVLLVDELSPDVQAEIIERFGPLWDEGTMTLRAGSMLRIEHLERVAFTRAAAIVLPGAADKDSDAAGSDITIIKTLLTIASHPDINARERPPRVVAEIFDARKVPLAGVAYADGDLDILSSDLHVSRLMVQNLRNPGLSHVYGQLLNHQQGAEVYVRSDHGLTGCRVDEAAGRFEGAIVVGIVQMRSEEARSLLSPPADYVIQAEDQVVLVARSFDETLPLDAGDPRPLDAVDVLEDEPRVRHVLVLGWSDKLTSMVREMACHQSETWNVTVVSVVPSDVRLAELRALDLDLRHVHITHLARDFTLPGEMRRLEPASFDSVVLLGSDWVRSDEEADARTLVGYLTLKSALDDTPRAPHILVEITDPANASLFDERRGEVVVSPLLISNLLAHVTLRAAVLPVFDELFSAGGPSLWFREPSDYGLAGRRTFVELAVAVRARGHVVIGVRDRDDQSGVSVTLVPSRDRAFDCQAVDLIVMAPTAFPHRVEPTG